MMYVVPQFKRRIQQTSIDSYRTVDLCDKQQTVLVAILGFLDLLSYCGLYELLTVIMQFGVFPRYLVYFFDHRRWNAYALPAVFSINGSRHSRSKTHGQNLPLNLPKICQNVLTQSFISIDGA
jgi:hypothetical protein